MFTFEKIKIKNLTFSTSDSLNRHFLSMHNLYSGDKKPITFGYEFSLLSIWLTDTILKATRPFDVICRLMGVTKGPIFVGDGVSAKKKN
jgi:hypothetical protein